MNLGDLIGEKAIVLYFYPEDDTPGCTAEACSFRDGYEDFVEAGAEVVGVSSDSAEAHGRFAAGNGLPFILLSDDGGEVRRLYGVSSTSGIFPGRVTYVIDKGASSGTSSPRSSARQGTWTKPSRSCKPSTRSLRADEPPRAHPPTRQWALKEEPAALVLPGRRRGADPSKEHPKNFSREPIFFLDPNRRPVPRATPSHVPYGMPTTAEPMTPGNVR